MTSDQIFRELDIEQSDQSYKAEMLGTILSAADLKFARIVDEVMTDEEREGFEEFSNGKGPQEIASWVNLKYEGIGEMYTAIVESIVNDLKSKNSVASGDSSVF